MKRARPAVAVVLLAIVLRLVAAIYVDALDRVAGEYRQIALHLVNGQGFSFLAFSHLGPTSVRPPVYPYLLAGFYSTLGVDRPLAHGAAIAFNALCGGISCGLLIALTHRWWVGLLLAIWPTQIYAATQMQGLSLGLCLMLATLLLLRRCKPLSAGLFAGAAVLTEAILFLPLAIAILVTLRRKPAELLVCGLAMLTLTLPWVYRNTLVHGRPTLVTDNLGPDLFLGNGPDATGSHHLRTLDWRGQPQSQIDRLTPPQFDQLKRQPEAVRNAKLMAWSLAWVRDNPLSYAQLSAIRAGKTLWMDWHHPMAWQPLNLAVRSLGLLILIAAVFLPAFRRKAAPAPAETAEETGGRVLAFVVIGGLVAATVLTLAEARNAVFMDAAQLLLLPAIADKRRE